MLTLCLQWGSSKHRALAGRRPGLCPVVWVLLGPLKYCWLWILEPTQQGSQEARAERPSWASTPELGGLTAASGGLSPLPARVHPPCRPQGAWGTRSPADWGSTPLPGVQRSGVPMSCGFEPDHKGLLGVHVHLHPEVVLYAAGSPQGREGWHRALTMPTFSWAPGGWLQSPPPDPPACCQCRRPVQHGARIWNRQRALLVSTRLL